MKKLFSTGILMLIFSIIPTQIFSQKSKKIFTINAETSIGRNLSDCRHPGSFCGFKTTTDKSTANTQVSFNKESNELTLVFSKTTLEQTNKDKLLNNKLEKDFYLYTFNQDFILPKEVKDALNITKFSKIKQGNYLVKIVKDKIIMKLKLE